MRGSSIQKHLGISMIEVLVAMIVIAVGLLGLARLQTGLQGADVDAYQRAQALSLIEDISSRIALNRGDAAAYLIAPASPTGFGASCGATLDTRAKIDLNQWCNALEGASEIEGTTKRGAMIGARGCVEAGAAGEYVITVTWQGLRPVAAPPASVGCAQGLYDAGGTSGCVGDLCRRYLSTVVRIANLE